jgi:hypothetical protein
LAAGLKVRSDTAVAGLFLEVIVRHIPGLGWLAGQLPANLTE